MGHAIPQRPQCIALVLRFVSQPSVASMLQSPKPAVQAATAQAAMVQVAVALARTQRRPQAPQLFTLEKRSISQPLAGRRSQSAKPVLHAPTVQAPAVHEAVALASAQVLPQAPQLAVVVVGVSQPSVFERLQSAKPAVQAPIAQAPAVHAAAALA